MLPLQGIHMLWLDQPFHVPSSISPQVLNVRDTSTHKQYLVKLILQVCPPQVLKLQTGVPHAVL